MKRSPARLVLIVSICFGMAGCVSPEDAVNEQERVIAKQFAEETRRIVNLKDERIGWDAALELMTAENAEIIGSRNQVKAAEESLAQVYRSLIPGVSISAGVSSAITDLANLKGDDFSLNVLGFINIPGLVSYGIRYYASALELTRARWAYELQLREQTIALYEQFLQYQLLQERTRNIVTASRFQDAESTIGGLDANPEMLVKEELALSLERQNRSMQASISRLLGSTRSRWVLDPETIPQWNYVEKPLEVNNPEKFATLYRQLQAVQLEGHRLSKLGVKFKYWPEINVSVSTPPIYSVRDSRAKGFDVESTLVALNTNVQLDTQLAIWTQLKQIERRVALDKKRLQQENAILIEQLMTNQKALALNRKQARLNEIRRKFLSKEERTLDLRKNRDQLEKSLALGEQWTTLLIERAQLQSSLWLLDERRWQRIQWDAPDKE